MQHVEHGHGSELRQLDDRCNFNLGHVNKDQLSLTNLRDALHHGERAANK